MMTAHTPWSGFFSIDQPIYALAHTTLFTQPGWLLHRVGSGSGWLSGGGSYVAYTDPADTASFTLVIEKVDPSLSSCQFESTPRYAVTAERATFQVGGPQMMGAAGKVLNVYWSNLASSTFLQRNASVTVADDGTFAIAVGVDDLITVTTAAWSKPAYPAPPLDSAFPCTITDDFDGDAVGSESALFAQMSGAFEVDASAVRSGTNTLQQRGVGKPVKWLRNDLAPFTQMGTGSWGATSVSVDVAAVTATAVFVGVRGKFSNTDGSGLLVGVDTAHALWFAAQSIAEVMSGSLTGNYQLSGPLPAARKGVFNTLNVSVAGTAATATATINGKQVFSSAAALKGALSATGTVVLGTSDYGLAEFDNFVARGVDAPSPPGPGPSPPSPSPGLPPLPPQTCLHKPPGAAPGATLLRLFACTPGLEGVQRWEYSAQKQLVLRNSPAVCAGLPAHENSNGSKAVAADLAAANGNGCSGKCLSVLPCSSTNTTVSAPTVSPSSIRVLSSVAAAVRGNDENESKRGALGQGSEARGTTTEEARETSMCFDVDMAGADPYAGTVIQEYKCNGAFKGGANQKFAFDPATGILSSSLYAEGQSCLTACWNN